MLKSSSTTDPVALALSLKEKEKEIIKNFIYHGIGNTDDELYIYLFELLNGRPPIGAPDNFSDLMSLLNQCKADIIAGKSISLNIMKRMTISCATVNQNVPTTLKQVPDVPDAKVDSTPSVPKQPKKNKKTRADAAKVLKHAKMQPETLWSTSSFFFSFMMIFLDIDLPAIIY